MADTRVLVDSGLVLCDGPRWFDDALWFSDLYGGYVYTVDHAGRLERVLQVQAGPSGLEFQPDGSLLVVSQRDQKILRRTPSGAVSTYADLAGRARHDANDIVLDSAGRAYVSSFGFDLGAGAPLEPAPLVMVEPDGAVRVVADGLRFPNAVVLTDDERTLLVSETEGNVITAFDRAPDGTLSGRRVFADLGDLRPDGMCLDADGQVWVACLDAEAVVRVAAGGRETARVRTPGRWATACVLGGPARRDLFVLTARTSPEMLARGEFHGAVEVVEVDVPGAGRP
ncbi:SMP-30/gluconolactonase/LRE family protein [Actinophytocola sediminis]